jgi:hypothetical protein
MGGDLIRRETRAPCAPALLRCKLAGSNAAAVQKLWQACVRALLRLLFIDILVADKGLSSYRRVASAVRASSLSLISLAITRHAASC